MKIVTTQTTGHGTGPTLAIYRMPAQPGAYLVGQIDAQTQTLTPLPDACFWTYDAAKTRLAAEGRQLDQDNE